jgi:hypothetical protein
MERIQPLKPALDTLPRKYWAFDSETNGLGGDPLLICAKSNMGDIKIFDDEFCCERFLRWLLKDKKFLKGDWFFAHNLKFDIGKIFGQVLGDENWDVLMAGSRLIIAKYILKHGGISKSGKKRGNDVITFVDTYNLLVAPLEQIGKSLNYPKGKTPQKFIDGVCKTDDITDEDIQYCLQDCDIVLKFLEFYGTFLAKFQVKLRPTIASNAKAIWNRTFLAPTDRTYWINDIEDEKFRSAYFGGRTEVFISRKEIEHGYHYDINSQYPSQMKYNLFPNPNKLRSFDNPKDFIDKINMVEGCATCTVTAPNDLHIPILPFRGTDNLLFPIGTFKGTWCLPELRIALKLGYEIDVHSCTVSKPHPSPFLDYIKIFEDMKEDAVRTGDMAIKEMSKRFMNALSGKFGQRIPAEDRVYTRDDSDIPPTTPYKSCYGVHITQPADLVRSEGTAVCLIAYVTSYSRCLLHSYMDHNTLYCDTDSIFTYERLPDSMVHPTKFGMMALEDEFEAPYFIDPKKYGYVDSDGNFKVVIKGVGKKVIGKAIKYLDDLDHDVLSFDETRLYQFKTALANGLVPMQQMTGVKDVKRHSHPKRIFDKYGNSRPVTLVKVS